MRSRDFFKWVGAVTFVIIILITLPMAGLAAEISLKLGHITPTGSTFDVASNKFAEQVAAKTKGRVEIKVFANAQFGTPPEHWAQVKTGAIDLYVVDIGAASMVEPKPKNLDATKAPYVFDSQAELYKFLRSDLFKTMMAKVEIANNMKYIGYVGDRPPRGFSTTKKRATTPDDIKGLKLRVPHEPIFVAMYKGWGAAPTPVAPKEVYTSLKSGLVEGMDGNIDDIYSGKHYEIQKYFIAIDYLYSVTGIWINAKKWESFSEDVKTAFLKSAEETDAYVSEFTVKQAHKAENAFKEAGVEIIRPDLRPWKELAEKAALKNDGELWEKGLYEKIKAQK